MNMYGQQYYKEIESLVKQYWEDKHEIATKNTEMLRFVLTTLSVVFGILVSLGNRKSDYLQIRLCFAIGVCLLALSILFLGISLQAEITHMKKANDLFQKELKKAFAEQRPAEPVYAGDKKNIFSKCETIGYVCCVLSLLCLCVFAFLQVFYT